MNNDTIAKMIKAQEQQFEEIRNLDGFKEKSDEFEFEYSIAKSLQQAREKAKLTQKEIAKRMGTTQSVISRIESGRNVSINTLEKYARACGKHLELSLV